MALAFQEGLSLSRNLCSRTLHLSSGDHKCAAHGLPAGSLYRTSGLILRQVSPL